MNALIKVRKIVSHVENIFHEGGQTRKEAIKKGAILIVLENPYAGDYVDEITPMMAALKPVGLDAAGQLIEIVPPFRRDGIGVLQIVLVQCVQILGVAARNMGCCPLRQHAGYRRRLCHWCPLMCPRGLSSSRLPFTLLMGQIVG